MKKLLMTLCLLSLAACGMGTIDTGHRGFFIRFGEVEDKVLPEGLYFYNPFTESLHSLNTQTQVVSFQTETYTRDMQLSDITYTLTFSLDQDSVVRTYKVAGDVWQDKLVAPVLAGAVKQIVGQYEAVDLIANRQKATQAVKEFVVDQLAHSNVRLIELQLSEIKFSKAFEEAVEQKVIATQQAEQAKNKTLQIEEEAKQQVIAATAEAKSMQIRSEALSKNQNLVSYEAVQKWDGKMPVYMMGGATPFITLDPGGLRK